jgi:hypothetical protein
MPRLSGEQWERISKPLPGKNPALGRGDCEPVSAQNVLKTVFLGNTMGGVSRLAIERLRCRFSTHDKFFL